MLAPLTGPRQNFLPRFPHDLLNLRRRDVPEEGRESAMSMLDYLPRRDSDFLAWLNAFISFATANSGPLGLISTDITAMQSAVSGYSTALGNRSSAQQAAQGATQAKDLARATAEKLFRRYARDLQNRPTVTNQQRAALGLRVRDTNPTAGNVMMASTAPTRPLVLVDNGRKLIHRLRFVEEGQPTRKARPAGVKGIEIWRSILPVGSPAPGDASTMSYVDTPSCSPLLQSFAAADAGKIAWYLARWVANDGSKGDWSTLTSAMILG